ncbi:MAG: hypothetical protein J6W80_06455 [Kiritimatiellae bacterium]|nr:hypothetical protein [Kiritimatiellia bacterium]
MKKITMAAIGAFATVSALAAAVSEISVDMRLDESDYVAGERVRAVVTVKNMSPDRISVGFPSSRDRLFVEVYRAHNMSELTRMRDIPFVAKFRLDSNEGQKLETFLADHFALGECCRYLARPVLVHNSTRYEGQYRAFDVVPGMELGGALQIFDPKCADGLSREFRLVHWTRKGSEHLFVTAEDKGSKSGKWITHDIGSIMRITKPTISILPTGEVVVIHRTNPDQFIRSEFWSLPNALELRTRQLVQDPETAGQTSIQNLYDSSGGVKPVDRPWWKFW